MQVEFPGDAQAEVEIRNELREKIDFAKRLLRFWIGADLDQGFSRTPWAPIVKRVLLANIVRSSRQFRTVLELCERGEGVDASIICRSLFETALAIAFVLRPRVTLRKFDRRGVPRPVVKQRNRLSREFRATLVVAHHVLEPERFVQQHENRPSFRRHAEALRRRLVNDTVAQHYKKVIGSGWTSVLLSAPWTYSGLTVANLARSLGQEFSRWYTLIYGDQSQHVHAADIPDHIDVDDEIDATSPRWHSSVVNSGMALCAATAMFLAVAGLFDKYMRLGISVSTAIGSFEREFLRLHGSA
jgi:hypothetical protein